MAYNDTNEDELDRMRRRHQQKKQGASQAKTSSRAHSSRSTDTARTTAASKTAKNVHARNGHARRKKKRSIFPIFLILLVIAFGMLVFRRNTGEGYWTIVVFGVDSRDGNLEKGALSDVEMLCSINRKTGEIRLASVFRDSYLRIDSEGSYDKINEAYFLGGHTQAVDALRDNLDVPIDDYATFNWKAVVDAINVLGGVDIEITDKEFAYINSFITETVNATGVGSVQLDHSGLNHLDGVQAVAYARLRLMDTDFNRTERQRKVLGQVMEKAKAADFSTLKTLVGAVFPQISTSIGVDDLLSVAKDAKRYYIGQTSGFPFSHSEMKIGKKACVIPTTLESNVIQLHSFLYDDTQYTPSGTVSKISAHIAEVSGLDTPGKDTESGKNVGAQGNTGSGAGSAPAETTTAAQNTPEPSPDAAEAPAGENTADENEAEGNNGNMNDTEGNQENENGASDNSENSATENSGDPFSDGSHFGSPEQTIETHESETAPRPSTEAPGNSSSHQTGPGVSGSETGAPGISGSSSSESSSPSGNRPSNAGQSNSNGPGSVPESSNSALTGPGQSSESSTRSGTTLEAPGQSSQPPAEAAGPGV